MLQKHDLNPDVFAKNLSFEGISMFFLAIDWSAINL